MKFKKLLAMVMTLCITIGSVPSLAHAEEHLSCSHHTIHTEQCGYVEETVGVDCNHQHSDECYTITTEVTESVTCIHTCDENCEVDCTHTCDEQCITRTETEVRVENCTHEHNTEDCGYVEAKAGQECNYTCKICPVQDIINNLPDEITVDNKQEVETSLTEIDNKRLELSDEEMNLIDFTKYVETIEKLTGLSSEPMVASNDMNTVYTSFVDSAAAVGDGSEQNPFNSFHKALDAVVSGGQIIVVGKGLIEAEDGIEQNGSEMVPYKINKSVTITGQNNAYLSVETAGIILEADVTFENIKIGLANHESNAIFANGHTLTLINSGKTNSTRDVHLFTGGLDVSNASSGADGYIEIDGVDTSFGNIYCGSMDDEWNNNSSVLIQNTSINEIGKIYGSGAEKGYYNRDNFFSGVEPEAPAADDIAFPTNGDVNISLVDAGITEIDGAVRNGYKASVSVSTQYPKHNLSLEDIGTLCVESGELKPVTLNNDANLIVNGSAIADLSGIAFENEITLSNLDARTGSIIRLNKNQKIEVTGDFVGEFELQSNTNISMSGTESGLVNTDTIYVDVLGNNGGTINFNPASTQAGLTLVRDGQTWKTSGNSEVELEYQMISFGITETEIDREEDEVSSITVGVTYETSEDNEGYTGYLEWFPLRYEVTFNGNNYTTNSTYYDVGSYYYGELPELGMTFYPLGDENGVGEIEIILADTIAVGTYTINVIVPAENTESGAIISDTFTVKVNGEQGGQPPVLSSDKSVACVLVNGHSGEIDGQIITVDLPAGETLVTNNSLIHITVANTSTVSNLTTSDGGATWTFTVIAEDSSTADYTINVNLHVHEYNRNTFEKDETNHWYECGCGDKTEIEPHTFDNNCDIDCNDNCGFTRQITHNYSNTWVSDDIEHWKACECGDKKDIEVHNPVLDGTTGNYKCSVCDRELQSGTPHSHSWGNWTSNGDNTHTRVCNESVNHTETLNCTGGTATCKDRAICEECNTEYGEKDLNNHTGGTEVRGKVDATTSAEGYTGDNYCLGCDAKIGSGQTIPKKTSSGNTGSGSGNTSSGSGNTSSGSSSSSTSTPSTSTPSVPNNTQTKPVEQKLTFEDYSVKRGDTLSKIAKRYGTTVVDLVNANKDLIKNPNIIRIGWILKISTKGTVQNQVTQSNVPAFTLPDNRQTVNYTIKRGDSLWRIARANGCTVHDLVAFNADTIKNPNVIIAGWTLRIPKK